MEVMHPSFSEMDVVILCGGQGTRLRTVLSDRPKGLAAFGEKTFLDILVEYLISRGFRRFILCVGYMKDQIEDHFSKPEDEVSIEFSEEMHPLGTGGALKNARFIIHSNTFLLLNGDSFCDVDFEQFYTVHQEKHAILSMALVRKADSGDFGTVVLNDTSSIVSFREKAGNEGFCLVNAGIYLMEKEIFSLLPADEQFSLENDVFPNLALGMCTGFITDSELIDIGTPERYQVALKKLRGRL